LEREKATRRKDGVDGAQRSTVVSGVVVLSVRGVDVREV